MRPYELEDLVERIRDGIATLEEQERLRTLLTEGRVTIDTGGGTSVVGNVAVERGDFIGRDRIETNNLTLTVDALALLMERLYPRAIHTLRAPATNFTGREREIELILEYLRRADGASAVISGIRGMGGVGKTELALVVAHALRPRFPDAQVLVELQPGGEPLTPEDLLARVIATLAPQAHLPGTSEELQALYRATLHGQRGLLLLDNAASRQQVAPLLLLPTGWVVLVTSRRRFGLAGGQLLDLDVLSEPEALALLRRLLDATGRPELGDPADETLRQLARACGSLPLALRLAAAYLGNIHGQSLEGYLDLLAERPLSYLRDEDERVDRILGLSVEQLAREDPTLAARWQQLAVFPAPFDGTAAAAAWGRLEGSILTPLDDAETRETLGRLERRNLLRYDAERQRYELHDLLRAYAARSMEERSDAWHTTLLRHALHYLTVGAEAERRYTRGGPDLTEALHQWDDLWPHLRAATERVTGTGSELVLHFRYRVCSLMPQLISLRLPPQQRIAILQDALRAAREVGDRRAEESIVGNLGAAYGNVGELHQALGYFQQALAVSQEIGDQAGMAAYLGNLGSTYRHLGRRREAIHYLQQALAMSRETGDRRTEGNLWGSLGSTHGDFGQFQQAIECYERALVISRELGDRRAEGNWLGGLGVAHTDLGHLHRALDLLQQAFSISEGIGDEDGEATHSWNLGLVYERQGRYARAAAHMHVLVEYLAAINHPDAERHAFRLETVRRKAAAG